MREAMLHPEKSNDIVVKYVAPWTNAEAVMRSSVDLICSHSVLAHVTDIPSTFDCCHAWLRQDGWMSHQIDFTAHGITKAWNGHWQYPEWLWKIIVGGRPYLINRHPASAQVRMLQAAGFDVGLQMRNHRTNGMPRSAFARQWRTMSEADATCCSMYVQARKR
jgi:hypothetical protein